MNIIGHLIGSLFRAFFRIVFTVIIMAIIGGGITLGVAYVVAGQHWPPTILTDVAAAVIGILAAYAGGMTVLVQEAVRGVKAAETDISKAV